MLMKYKDSFSYLINKYYKIEKKYFNFINLNLIQILKK